MLYFLDPNFMDSAIRFMNRINFDHIPRAQQLILLDSKPMKVWTVPSLSRARTPPLIQHPTTPDGSIGNFIYTNIFSLGEFYQINVCTVF